ncbi:hypothetical protein LEP3755_34170 [Leptolyngbya sp. NIES-3755]|nr:hypothetical protein LEP3755_34170 [Leptolyngbya sp. NIES-3755]
MKRFDLLKSQDDRLYLINCTLRIHKLESGLVVMFSGLPASVPVYADDELITTVEIPNPERIVNSCCGVDVVFDLNN